MGKNIKKLEKIARKVRRDIIEMILKQIQDIQVVHYHV